MQNPSPEHQKLIAALINHFVNKLGYQILGAAYGDYGQPSAHGHHEPDIVARDKNGLLHLAEAKVGDNILSAESAEQFREFSDRIMSDSAGNLAKTPVPLHIIVYKEDEEKLRIRLNQLGLGSKIGNRIIIWTL